MINKVLIIYDQRKERLIKGSKELFQVFTENFSDVKIIPANKKLKGYDYDILVVFGGDGTLLRCIEKLGEHQIPILGVNIGKFGFLTYVERKQIKKAILDLKKSNFTIQNRMLLEINVADTRQHLFRALNEVVIHRENLLRIIEISLFINKKYVANFSGDGIIIATPTGSTAHSLSAGGPIVHPQLENIIITPLTAHTLNVRPLVISANDLLYIKLSDYKDTIVTFDGQGIIKLNSECSIKVAKARYYAKFITFNDWDFFRLLVDKFYWGIKRTTT